MFMKFFGTLVLTSQLSWAQTLSEGSYQGKKVETNSEVHLLLKAAPERVDSFYAVFMHDSAKISLYVVDRFENSYVMTPLEVTSDGYIGVINDDPSLLINLTGSRSNIPSFMITSTNSGNTRGLQGSFKFEGRTSNKSWIGPTSGQFGLKGNKSALNLGAFDSSNNTASAFVQTKSISGNFILSQKIPGMFLLNAQSIFATGEEINKTPRAIGIFMESSGWGRSTYFILINPQNDSDLLSFEHNGSGNSSRSSDDDRSNFYQQRRGNR